MFFESEKIKIDKLPDEPVVVVTLLKGYDYGDDMIESNKPSFTLLDSQDKPVFWILDMRQARIGFGEVVASANMMTRGEEPLWKHPMIRETVIVSDAQMVKLAAKGLSSDVFGNLSIKVFGTVEEALDYVRSAPAA
ncbi:MAG: hypothetical protein JXB30_02630 [Anaerolineae bacterium]|nr:hypothetical protein [Anaerolineae bacterium]